MKASFSPRYAITFGEVAVLHIGGKEFGECREVGFTVDELRNVQIEHPDQTKLVMISDVLPAELRKDNEAAVLLIKDGVRLFGGNPDELLAEQQSIEYDTKYWDTRRRKTLNKQARYNIVFGEHGQEHNEDYTHPTVQAYTGVPSLAEIRARLPEVLGPKAKDLNAEGNHYYKPACGIGFHGDVERKIVICLSLGSATTLRYHWRMPGSSEHTLSPMDIEVEHGDIYVMSERAVGGNWRKRSQVRVVHAAGAKKYVDK